MLLNAPDGGKVQVSTTGLREQLAPEGAAGPFPIHLPSMSSAAAEAGDAGGHPWEHAVCRGGVAPEQTQGWEGGKYQELNRCNLT